MAETSENAAIAAENTNPTQLFDEALALQQQKNWEGALTAYKKLLDIGIEKPNFLTFQQSSVIYHNMSVIANEQGDLLHAYVWSKKSFFLDASNGLAKEAYLHYSKKFEVPTIPRQLSTVDQYKMALSKIPVDAWFILSVSLILLSFWLFVKHVIKTRKNLVSGVFSKIHRWPVYTLVILSLFVISNAYVAYIDSQKSLAVVTADKAQVQTAPGENKPIIYEAVAGLELEVLRFEEDYYLVRYAGAFSGWINKKQIEILGSNFQQIK